MSKQPTTTKKPKPSSKKKKLPSISKVKKDLWKVVSKRIKERDNYICFTSGKKVEGMNAHCGHMHPSAACGALLRYHPKNLHCQSYNENINLGGNGVMYATRFIEVYGEKEFKNLLILKNRSIKADIHFYLNLLDLYKYSSLEEVENYLNNLY
jgi:hypothetical protein